jgi:DNA-binding response OmpR family regulator
LQSLTSKECELLRLLCINQNKLVTREKALLMIWGDNNYFNGRSMDVFITKLRKHLKSDPSVEIVNVHGSGYKLMIHRYE